MVIYNDNMRLKLTHFITINGKANIKFALIHKYLLYNSTFYLFNKSHSLYNS